MRNYYYGREFQTNIPNFDYVSPFTSLSFARCFFSCVLFTHIHTQSNGMDWCQLICIYMLQYRRMRKFICMAVVLVYSIVVGLTICFSLYLPHFCVFTEEMCACVRVCVNFSSFFFSSSHFSVVDIVTVVFNVIVCVVCILKHSACV